MRDAFTAEAVELNDDRMTTWSDHFDFLQVGLRHCHHLPGYHDD